MDEILKGCINKNRKHQKALFDLYYKYGLAVSLAYCNHVDEAREVLNDAFLKVFERINDYDPTKPFEAWFRIIVIRTAINHFHKQANEIKWTNYQEQKNNEMRKEDAEDKISDMYPDEVHKLAQQLPPAYRMAINLYAVEGYSHQEIAENLGISIGTSKSNLSKARARLKLLISQCKLFAF